MFQVLLPSHEPHVLPGVLGLVRALERQKVGTILSPLRNRTWRGLAKFAGICGLRQFPGSAGGEVAFFHLNHPWVNALYPYCLTNPCVTYSFDCWPAHSERWECFFRRNQVRAAFISARQSAEAMSRRCPATDFRWLPEAVEPNCYQSDTPLVDRSIDVLELGRRFELYHQAIEAPLRHNAAVHVYPERNRGLVFESHAALKAAFGNAKVSICFPQSMTHPARAGGVETVTLRYFESMASGCLIVGHCPQELVDLFGYNPVIEARLDVCGAQLLNEILPNISRYQGLVARNYSRLLEVGTVESSASAIVSALRAVETRQSDRVSHAT